MKSYAYLYTSKTTDDLHSTPAYLHSGGMYAWGPRHRFLQALKHSSTNFPAFFLFKPAAAPKNHSGWVQTQPGAPVDIFCLNAPLIAHIDIWVPLDQIELAQHLLNNVDPVEFKQLDASCHIQKLPLQS